MKIRCTVVVFLATAIVLSATALRSFADDAPRSSEKNTADMRKIVEQLSNPDPVQRQRAMVKIEALAFFEIPIITDLAGQADLNGKTRAELARTITRIQLREKWRTKERARSAIVTQWMRHCVIADATKRADGESPWLDEVKKAVELEAEAAKVETKGEQKAIRQKVRKQLDAALAAGCTDPAFLAMNGLFSFDTGATPEKCFTLFSQARENAKGIEVSPYISIVIDRRLLLGLSEGIGGGPADAAKIGELGKEIWTSFSAMLKDPATPDQVKIDLARSVVDICITLRVDPQWMYKNFYVQLAAIFPNEPQVLYLKGQIETKLAWAARGSGFANTVTPQGWKDFAAHLQLANEALTRSYDLDPNDPAAATQMMTVVLGQDGDRVTMETWFKRAMNADPDNIQACRDKMYYLEPKWHGDADAMLEFGHQCLQDANWHSANMPLMIVNAHSRLAAYEPDKNAYYRKAGVWEDIHNAYSQYLDVFPDVTGSRSIYCHYACLCGEWKEADAQFKILGDKASVSAFGTQATMDSMRKQAEELGTDK